MTGQGFAFEQRLREALTGSRPVEGAPVRLHQRIDRIAEEPTGRLRVAWSRLATGAIVVVGVLAIGVALGLLRLRQAPPVGSGNAPAATFDPSIDGLGILAGVFPSLLVVPVALGLAIAAAGMYWARRATSLRWLRLAIGLAAGAIVAAMALHPGFLQGSSYGPEFGYDLQIEPPPGADYPPTWYSTAQPGGPTMVFVTVRNDGPLPIKLEGLVETVFADRPLIPRWTSVWLGDDPNSFGASLEHLLPFSPQTVEPGAELQLYLVGRAGLCAYGPGYAIDTPIQGTVTRERSVALAYSVLGLQSTSSVELYMTLAEPERQSCDAIRTDPAP